MRFKQSATGALECGVVPDTPHCGIDETNGHFHYAVEIVYSDRKALDANGFLLDNLTFSAYFNSLGKLRVSCEAVAEAACEYFTELLAGRAQYIVSVSVKIFPFEGVFVEAIHDNAQPVTL